MIKQTYTELTEETNRSLNTLYNYYDVTNNDFDEKIEYMKLEKEVALNKIEAQIYSTLNLVRFPKKIIGMVLAKDLNNKNNADYKYLETTILIGEKTKKVSVITSVLKKNINGEDAFRASIFNGKTIVISNLEDNVSFGEIKSGLNSSEWITNKDYSYQNPLNDYNYEDIANALYDFCCNKEVNKENTEESIDSFFMNYEQQSLKEKSINLIQKA